MCARYFRNDLPSVYSALKQQCTSTYGDVFRLDVHGTVPTTKRTDAYSPEDVRGRYLCILDIYPFRQYLRCGRACLNLRGMLCKGTGTGGIYPPPSRFLKRSLTTAGVAGCWLARSSVFRASQRVRSPEECRGEQETTDSLLTAIGGGEAAGRRCNQTTFLIGNKMHLSKRCAMSIGLICVQTSNSVVRHRENQAALNWVLHNVKIRLDISSSGYPTEYAQYSPPAGNMFGFMISNPMATLVKAYYAQFHSYRLTSRHEGIQASYPARYPIATPLPLQLGAVCCSATHSTLALPYLRVRSSD